MAIDATLDALIIDLTINLTPPPAAPVGFGEVLLLVDEAAGNPLPGGVRSIRFTSVGEASTAQAAGEITAAVLQGITDAFTPLAGQSRVPTAVQVGRVDTAALESYPDALALVLAGGANVWAVCADTRVAADQVALDAAIASAANRMIGFWQSSDVAWKIPAGGIPAAYTGIDSGRSLVVWHDTDAEWADLVWATNRLAFDPDVISVVWNTPLPAVLAYATGITTAERDAIIGNGANVVLPYYSATSYVFPGESVNASGAGFTGNELLTRDWFEQRAFEYIAAEQIKLATRGEKIPVTIEGQGIVLGALAWVVETSQTAGHIVKGQIAIRGDAIDAADLAGLQLSFTGEGQIENSAKKLIVGLSFGRQAVVTS